MIRLVTYFIFILFVVLRPIGVVAQECDSACGDVDECTRKIAKCQEAWNQMEAAVKPHQDALAKMEADIAAFQARIKVIEADIARKSLAIGVGEKELSGFLDVAGARIRQFYKRTITTNPFTAFLSKINVGAILRVFAYQQAVTNEDKRVITQTALSVKDLQDRRTKLEHEQSSLAYLKEETDRRAESVRKLVGEATAYQSQLSGIIASLTARQQSILSEKSGTFQTTVGDVPLADDPASRPDYNPGFSPAFAAFSFGAPHFNGLSQYGAYGRAKVGHQDVETILHAYYGDVEIKKDYDQNANICVGSSSSDCTNVPLETYAKRIYEMPGSWGDDGGMDALKAQAVAARSYALSSMARNGYICSSESCQVYKPENKGGKWEEAVNATAGWVMMKNGKPLMAKYASTAGGYIDPYTDSYSGHSTPGFWDTPSGRSGWTSQAWEKVAASPWFYKGWYRSRSGDSCGRSHPWLTSEEMADILNGWHVLYEGGGDSGRVTPLGSCWGGSPYSMDELRGIGGYSSVSSVSVTYSDSGITSAVTFQTNKGSVSINGNDFYKAFNLRAPARIALKSGLFNIEKK
jgi:peptidoglycan hydrolase-like amidase